MQFQNLCTRCARSGHKPHDCPYAEAKCHQCGKTGHLVAACARKDKGNSTKNNNNANKSTTEDSDDTGYNRTSLVYSQADGDTPREVDNSTERWIWIDSWPSHQRPTPRMRVAQAQAREARAVQLPRRPRRTTAMSGLIYLAHDLGYLQLCKYSRGGVT
jgi:hypothetical protein